MENLVIYNESNVPVTNSLLVAEKFGKYHKDILETIRRMKAENSAVLSMFCETTYFNEQNKQQPMYIMNRDGFSLLVMGFTGKEALQFKVEFIEAFNKMENALKNQFAIPQTYSEALKLAAAQAEKIEIQQKQLAIQKIKCDFVDVVFDNNENVSLSQAAKLLGLPFGRNTMCEKLRNHGIFFKNKNEPQQRFLDAKYFELKESWIERSNNKSFPVITPLVTQKGLSYLCKIFQVEPKKKLLTKIV